MIELFDYYNHYNLPYPNNNGDVILRPISCTVTAQVNGTWQLKISHPLDEEGRWTHIIMNSVLRVPSHNGKQYFRIKHTEKTDATIEATADPIFFDAGNDCFLMDVRPTSKTGQQALTAILAPNNKYTGVSNIATVSTSYYVRKNAMEAINGSDENSFLNRWGGEIEYDNFTIKVNTRIGSDNGVQIRTGKNLPRNGLKMVVDITNTINRIVPLAYNGHGMSGGTPWVDAIIPAGVPIRTGVITFENIRLASDTGYGEGETIPDYITICADQAALDTALTDAANNYYTETHCAESRVDIDAEVAVLQSLEEYKGFTGLETIGLGDTLYLYNKNMDINAQPVRVMELEWDCIRNVAKRIIARTSTSRTTTSSETVTVGSSPIPFSVDNKGNVVMGDKLIFGNSSVTVPTWIQHIYGNANGSALLVRPGGPLVIGGGEYASNRYAQGDISASSNETAYLGSDSNVYIESNANTIGSRKTWTFNASGNLVSPNGSVYDDRYKSETVTVQTVFAFGYAGNSDFYFEVMLPKKIADGSTIALTAFTGAIRGVNGTVAANATNLLSNTTASLSNNGNLKLQISNQTTNYKANSPAHLLVNSITFTVS